MTRVRRSANGYDYVAYESDYYSPGEWDVIPACFGQNSAQPVLRPVAQPVRRKAILEGAAVVERIDPAVVRRRRSAALYSVMILIIFMLMVVVVYRYAVLSDMHIDNLELQESIEALDIQVEKLEETLAGSRDLEAVMDRAEELGMSFAKSSQIRYIELGGISEAETAGG